jgi:tRNA-binding EMAP/Myf-like protein
VTPKSGIAADSHTYDKAARKWERFDVEAALAELSDEDVQVGDQVVNIVCGVSSASAGTETVHVG